MQGCFFFCLQLQKLSVDFTICLHETSMRKKIRANVELFLFDTFQQVLAVLMFATTAGYNSIYFYDITCKGYPHRMNYTFGYPFDFKPFPIFCESTNNSGSEKPIPDSVGGKPSFFVAIGVLAMIYCILSLIWYVFLEVRYLNFDLVPVVVSTFSHF